MNRDNLYKRQIINNDVHIIEIPEGKIYLIDCEGHGTGKRPVFIPKENITVEEASEELEELAEDNENKTPEAPKTTTKKSTKK